MVAGEETPDCALPAPEAMSADAAETTCNLLYISDFVLQFKDWLALSPVGFAALRTAVYATAVDGPATAGLRAVTAVVAEDGHKGPRPTSSSANGLPATFVENGTMYPGATSANGDIQANGDVPSAAQEAGMCNGSGETHKPCGPHTEAATASEGIAQKRGSQRKLEQLFQELLHAVLQARPTPPIWHYI